MLKKVLFKSVASTAAVGTVLAGVALAPVATESPAIRNVACADAGYAGSITTKTDQRLSRYLGQYGSVNVSHVTVTADEGQLDGDVVVRIPRRFRKVVPLRADGTVNVRLPRRLRAGNTYRVVAKYLPACGADDEFRSSRNVDHYTVKKAWTEVTPRARNIRRGQRPTVNVDVASSTGVVVRGGKVRIRLIKNGNVRAVKTVRVRGGDASATFRKVWQRGRWRVKAIYLGNRNFARDAGVTRFRVRR